MIPQHVTSLETSQKLKELGVPQESEFYWDEMCRGEMHPIPVYGKGKDAICSAFLSSELGEMLPSRVFKALEGEVQKLLNLVIEKNNEGIWWVGYEMVDHVWWTGFADKNLSEAMGKMLFYLLSNNLIPPITI